MTMGIVLLASLAARISQEPIGTMTSTLSRTSSAANARWRYCPFLPNIAIRSRCFSRQRDRDLAALAAMPRREPRFGELPDPYTKPIRGIFAGCWASAGWAVVSKSRSPVARTKIFLTHGFGSCYSFSTTDHSTIGYSHLITLSALASTFGGIVRPSCFAVLRLMMNSNFVGCSMGSSLTLVPFKILSTWWRAICRFSAWLGP